jgi:hypothetical protein
VGIGINSRFPCRLQIGAPFQTDATQASGTLLSQCEKGAGANALTSLRARAS